MAIDFSQDGQYLATGSQDFTARIHTVRDGAEQARLIHELPLWTVRFSPDGKHLLTASEDHTARVWEIRSSVEVGRLMHDAPVRAAAFSPDGGKIATASDDVSVWLWRQDALIAAACARLAHNLSPEEWRRYIPDERYRMTCPQLP
jgi:WD40 repeat protein